MEPITDGELLILEQIWDNDLSTSRTIAEAIYPKVSDSKLASVQKLLERLELKRFVKRDRSSRAHRFTALISRENFLQNQLRSLADRHCDGSITPLVTTLIQAKGFTKKNRKQLRKLIDDLWPNER